MKTFLISAALSFCFSSLSLASIPKVSLILQKTAENSGSGIYQIEQEVQFPNGADVLVLKETWLVENENNMKLIVSGAKELKDQVSFSVQFSNGSRIRAGQSSRWNEEFIERYFHFRSSEDLAQTLAQMRLVPANVMAKKPIKNIKDFEPSRENFVRLSRSGGVINYSFGIPTPPDKFEMNPGFWIEQDQFVVRKFRLSSEVEVSAEHFSAYSRGLIFPRQRTVRWGPNSVNIQTLSVSGKGRGAWSGFGQKTVQRLDGLNNQPAAPLIEEFYKRFR